MDLQITLQKLSRNVYRDTDTRFYRDEKDNLWMSWTGDRPEILTHMLLNPEGWDVRVNYIQKRAQINVRIR